MARDKQSIHDWLIRQLVETNGFSKYAEDNNYVLATNPGDEKNVALGTQDDQVWPDVVIYDPNTKNASKLGDAKRIAEVETEDTVTLDHAKGHWDVYASRISDFILPVPKSLVEDVKKIISELNVACRLWSYQIETDDNGYAKNVSFSIET